MLNENPHKILIIRFDELGDSILTLPLIDALADKYPQAQIAVASSKIGHDVFEQSSNVHRVFVCDYRKKDDFSVLIDEVKQEGFDAAFVVTEKIQGYILAFKAKIPVRVGFDPNVLQPVKSLMCKYLLTHRAEYTSNDNLYKSCHEVERQFLLLKKVNLNMTPRRYLLPVAKDDELYVRRQLGIQPENSIIVVHLSNKWIKGGWGLDEFYALIESLSLLCSSCRFVFTYSGQEQQLAEAVKTRFNSAARFLFCGSLSFSQWCSVISVSRLLLTMDTSASHVAAGLNVPCLTVFEEQHFEQISSRWRPWKTKCKCIMRPDLGCSVNSGCTETPSSYKNLTEYLTHIAKKKLGGQKESCEDAVLSCSSENTASSSRAEAVQLFCSNIFDFAKELMK